MIIAGDSPSATCAKWLSSLEGQVCDAVTSSVRTKGHARNNCLCRTGA